MTTEIPVRIELARPDDQVGHQAAADYTGVSVNSWRPYVSRGQAPQPDYRLLKGGHALPTRYPATFDAWQVNRPGQGVGGGRKPQSRADG